MKHEPDYQLIARHLTGQSDPADARKLADWREASAENERCYRQVKNCLARDRSTITGESFRFGSRLAQFGHPLVIGRWARGKAPTPTRQDPVLPQAESARRCRGLLPGLAWLLPLATGRYKLARDCHPSHAAENRQPGGWLHH